MSADAVIRKIEEKASREAAELLRAGETAAQQGRDRMMWDAQQQAAALRAEAERKAGDTRRSSRQKAEREARVRLLEEKRALLREAKALACEKLRALPEKEWAELMTAVVLRSGAAGEMDVVAPAADAQRYQNTRYCRENGLPGSGGLLEYWSALLTEQNGAPCVLLLSEEAAPFSGGMRLCGETFDIDLSDGALLDTVFAEQEQALAACLFENGGDPV